MRVLEQLEHVVRSGNAQLRRLHHAIGKTDDGAEIGLDDLPLPQHLAAEKAAVELLGPRQVETVYDVCAAPATFTNALSQKKE